MAANDQTRDPNETLAEQVERHEREIERLNRVIADIGEFIADRIAQNDAD